jgi:hypothetical protein
VTEEGTWQEFTPEARDAPARKSLVPGALVTCGILLVCLSAALLYPWLGLLVSGLFALKMSGAWRWPSPWPPRRPRD